MSLPPSEETVVTSPQRTEDAASTIRGIVRSRWATVALPLLISALLFVVGGVLVPGFFSAAQVASIISLAAILGFFSVGQTFVVISGRDGIDLSVGALLSFSAVVASQLISSLDGNLIWAIVVVAAVGAIIGVVNGLGVVALKLPPLIVTLAMAGVLNGLALVVSNGNVSGGPSPALKAFVTTPVIAGLSAFTLAVVVLGLVVWFLFNRLRFGKELLASGSNRSAALWAGVRADRVTVAAYALAGLLGGLGGIVLIGYTGQVTLSLGQSYTLLTVAAVVIGGTVLGGGVGSYWGTLAGAVLLIVLTALLTTLDLIPAVRQMVYGVTFLLVVLLYGRDKKLRQ